MGIISGSTRRKVGIISGSGSFRGQFGDHFRVGDHFGVGIISGAVQISLSPVLSTRVVTSYILVIINPFFTQDIIRISSRSLNTDHNPDPCHANIIGIPYDIPRCSRWHGLWFPIPCLMIPYFDSSVCRRLFLDPLPPFYTSEPLAIVFARAHSVLRDARNRAKSLSLFIDLPSLQKIPKLISLWILKLRCKLFNCILVVQRMHWIVKTAGDPRTY